MNGLSSTGVPGEFRSSVFPVQSAVVEPQQWYAIRTFSRHEKKAAVQLESQGIHAFLPLVSRIHRWSDRRKLVQLPLFPGYIFVRMVSTPETRLQVMKSSGVVGFVGIQGQGVPIPTKQIEDIQTVLARRVPCEPHRYLKVGQQVRIRGGCLDGVQGILLNINEDRSLIVSVELIQRSIRIRIEGYDLEST